MAHTSSWMAAALVLTSACLAATPDVPFTHGKAADGATKTAVCSSCHGPNGNSSNPDWPRLAGQNAVYIAEQLRLFRSGARDNPVMKPLAATLQRPGHRRHRGLLRGTDPDRPGGRPVLLAGRPGAVPARRPGARGPRVHRLPRPGGPRQPRGRLPGAARAAVRLRHQAAQGLCQRRALQRREPGDREPQRRHDVHDRQAPDARSRCATWPPTCRACADAAAPRPGGARRARRLQPASPVPARRDARRTGSSHRAGRTAACGAARRAAERDPAGHRLAGVRRGRNRPPAGQERRLAREDDLAPAADARRQVEGRGQLRPDRADAAHERRRPATSRCSRCSGSAARTATTSSRCCARG